MDTDTHSEDPFGLPASLAVPTPSMVDHEPPPWHDAELQGVRGTRSERFARPAWYRRPVVAILLVAAVAAGLRFWNLSSPHAYVFDETYYAKDGCFDAGFPFADCQLEANNEQTAGVHPPLGRWIIAGGVRLLVPADRVASTFDCPANRNLPAHCRPFAFRVTAATFGTLSVLLAALLAWELWASALWAGVSGLLLATESLNFVQSRVAMLDIFLATFVLAGFYFLVKDRRWIERRTPEPEPASLEDPGAIPPPPDGPTDLPIDVRADRTPEVPPVRPPSPIFRPWRLAAGVAFGAAVAVKWSGISALLGALILAALWEGTRRRRARLTHPWSEALRDEGFGVFVFLIVVPVAVYLASYLRWFIDHQWSLKEWWSLQHSMLDFSLSLRATHPYASRPWTWIFMIRPVSYYYYGSSGTASEVLGMGSPAIFWGSLIALPYVLFAGIRRRDWRAALILTAFGAQYFSWFLAARTSFLFYVTPITPFMVLGVTYAIRDLGRYRPAGAGRYGLAPVAAILVVAAVALFVWFYPVLVGKTISLSAWRARIWFDSWV